MIISKISIINCPAIKLETREGDDIIGHAYLYVMHNDLHTEPYGFLEDVFVEEAYRGQGVGQQLVQAALAEAKTRGCYKLIGTSRYSRPEVHEFYKKLGFEDYGKEFRMDLVEA